MNMKRNNYETMRDQTRPYFLTFDQEELIRKLDLEHDDEYLYIRFCSRPYRDFMCKCAVSVFKLDFIFPGYRYF